MFIMTAIAVQFDGQILEIAIFSFTMGQISNIWKISHWDRSQIYGKFPTGTGLKYMENFPLNAFDHNIANVDQFAKKSRIS